SYVIAAKSLRLARIGPHYIADGGRHNPLENRVAASDLQVLVGTVGDAAETLVGSFHADTHQPIHVFVRERIQHHRVDHAIHRGARADTERQRSYRDGGEARAPREIAQSETHVG